MGCGLCAITCEDAAPPAKHHQTLT